MLLIGALDEGDVYHLQLNQSKPILSQSVSQVQVPVLPLIEARQTLVQYFNIFYNPSIMTKTAPHSVTIV